jgi:hypothetical protein
MRNPILLFTAITFFALTSCSKKNANPDASTWTINGNTYTATKVSYDTTGGQESLIAYDGVGRFISVYFTVRPSYDATYTVLNLPYAPGYSATTCTVSYIDGPNAAYYNSTGKPGDVVNETIADGNLHLSFSNISVFDGKDSSKVSGTIIQLTNE